MYISFFQIFPSLASSSKPIRQIPSNSFVILNSLIFSPLCKFIIDSCEVNHNCVLSQHENHLTGIYPEILSVPVSRLALGLEEGREGAQEPDSGSQGPRSPAIRQAAPSAACPAAGEDARYIMGHLRTPTSLKKIFEWPQFSSSFWAIGSF